MSVIWNSCANSASVTATASEPAARGNMASLPQRESQQQHDQCGEDKAEIAPDGQELQHIQPVRRHRHGSAHWRIDAVPDRVAYSVRDAGGTVVAGRRHVDAVARVENDGAEHPADRLSETAAGILRARAGI